MHSSLSLVCHTDLEITLHGLDHIMVLIKRMVSWAFEEIHRWITGFERGYVTMMGEPERWIIPRLFLVNSEMVKQ